MAEDRIGWLAENPFVPKRVQREAILAADVKSAKIFELGVGGVETVSDVFGDGDGSIGVLRKGTTVCVYGIARLAPSWTGLEAVLELIAAASGKVLNVKSGRMLDPVALADVVEARREYAGLARIGTPEEAARRQAKGKRVKIPLGHEHEKVWLDRLKYPTNEDARAAIAKMLKRDISVGTIRNKFGSAGRMAGWDHARKRK